MNRGGAVENQIDERETGVSGHDRKPFEETGPPSEQGQQEGEQRAGKHQPGEVAELTGEPGVLPELLENEVVNKEKDHGSKGHRVGKRRRTALPEGRLKTV